VEGRGSGLIPGSAVEFQIKIPQIEGYLLPPEVVAGNAQGTIVYKVVDGKAVPVPVTLGQRTVDRVQIAKGVEKGDTILCVGASNIRPGMPVDIVEMR
jgi:membrane fusion protein (multidrug efflux system)